MKKIPHKIIFYSLIISFFMFIFTFALVPVYRTLCLVTGLSTAVIDPSILPDTSRDITIQFVAVNNAELPWEFHPQTSTLVVHPEENAKVIFLAKNLSKKTMTVQAIPSFAPATVGQFFHKIECFCFTQQTLHANETKEMPIVFRLDKDLPKNVRTMTLAYTLFDVTKGKGTSG